MDGGGVDGAGSGGGGVDDTGVDDAFGTAEVAEIPSRVKPRLEMMVENFRVWLPERSVHLTVN